MFDSLVNKIRNNLTAIVTGLLAIYFFVIFHLRVGFPPNKDPDTTALIYLAISIFFVLIPLARKINIAKFVEYEAKVQEIKADVKEFKDDTRQLISIYNNLTNTISSTVNHSIIVNLPGRDELEAAREDLEEVIQERVEHSTIEEEVSKYLALGENDTNFALARLRMDIERELRRILGKRLTTDAPFDMKGNFLSARSLFRELTIRTPKYKSMRSSFDYILKICNAAIHGQSVPEGHAHEALHMGMRILDELRTVVAQNRGEEELA